MFMSHWLVIFFPCVEVYKIIVQSKPWHKYVHTFLHKNVKENNLKVQSITETFLMSTVRTRVFHEASNGRFVLTLLEHLKNEHEFKMPTGNAGFENLNWDNRMRILEGIVWAPWSKQILWTFDLDKHLRLNLTFQHISFTAGKFYHCKFGQLHIKDINSKQDGHVFCGVHSETSNFPNYVKVMIKMDISFMASSNLQMFFSVIDKMVLISKKTLKRKKSLTPVWHVYFIKMRREIKYFHIQTLKLKFLLLSHDVSVDIFDGPGPLSPKIKTVNQAVTSTFQCVVIVYLTQEKNSHNIQYSAWPQVKQAGQFLSAGKHLVIAFPSSYQSNIEIIKFNTSVFHKINVTILNLKGISSRNPLCYHAGLAVYSEHFHEIYLECDNQTKSHIFKSTFSKSPSVILVLYHHPEYTSVNISLIVSTTQCQIKRQNTCFYTWRCFSYGRSYCLKANARYTKLMGDKNAIQMVNLQNNTCVVVQFWFEMNTDLLKLLSYRVIQCTVMSFRHKPVIKDGHSLATQVRALMHGKCYMLMKKPSCFLTKETNLGACEQ